MRAATCLLGIAALVMSTQAISRASPEASTTIPNSSASGIEYLADAEPYRYPQLWFEKGVDEPSFRRALVNIPSEELNGIATIQVMCNERVVWNPTRKAWFQLSGEYWITYDANNPYSVEGHLAIYGGCKKSERAFEETLGHELLHNTCQRNYGPNCEQGSREYAAAHGEENHFSPVPVMPKASRALR
ncbi:hypothetical protein HY640_05210 [Candidatus Woesearchaeota archaeon]|nr:hypothetical protein [Candidatus Woesearchaeota archaeon]